VEAGLRAIAECAGEVSTPVIPILAKAAEDHPGIEQLRILALTIFRESGLPMYNSLQETVNAIRCMLQWSGRRRNFF
jgi:hypothetical protein